MDLQNNLQSLRRSQALWAHNLWELSCAGFPATLQVFTPGVVLEGGAGRLTELGDVRDVLGVLGVDPVVPMVLRVLVSVVEERVSEEGDVLVVNRRKMRHVQHQMTDSFQAIRVT